MKFEVLRQHYGDRLYTAGETREANESDVAHLVRAGVLRKVEPKSVPNTKAAPETKAEAAPKNKSLQD